MVARDSNKPQREEPWSASVTADRLGALELSRLGNLELVARRVVEGFLIGLHRSPFRGFSVEFAENRPYVPGDDVRFLDWKMYARSDRFYIKQFDAETNLRAYLVLDVSRSMAWCSDPASLTSKLQYGRLLAASLAALMLRQGDAVGLLAFDEEVREHVRPRGRRAHLGLLLRGLAALGADGRTDAGNAIRDVAVRMNRRGLVLLLSDLLVEPAGTRRALRYLRHRGHDVLVLHIMDPAERELPASGDAIYFDPESGEELLASSSALRGEFRASVDRAIHEWRIECLKMGAAYHLLTTDQPLRLALQRLLETRSRLG